MSGRHKTHAGIANTTYGTNTLAALKVTSTAEASAACGGGRSSSHRDGGMLGDRLLRRGTTGHGDRKDGEGEDEVDSSEGAGEHGGCSKCC